MAGLPPGIRPWSGNNRRGLPGAPPGGVLPRTLPGLEGSRTRRKNARVASANPPMKHTGPRQVEQDLPAKMALARTVSDLDRRLQRTSAEIQEKENSLLAKTGQVDVLSQTVEFQQIKLNSLDLSLKLKEKEVSTLAKQLRQQERLIRRLQRKNEKLAGKREGAGEDTGSESDTTEGSDGSGQNAGDESQLEPSATEVSAAGVKGQLQSAAPTHAARLAAEAADADFDRSTALAQAPVPSQPLRNTPSAENVSPVSSAYGKLQQQADRELQELQDAGRGSQASVIARADDDGTEWFPIAAMCAVHSELSTRQPIPLDSKTCSLGQAVRILDVVSLRAAIENHSVDGETTFEWAPEDAQWAGRRGVLVQVNSHGFARVDFASSEHQGNETNSSFPEGIESPGVTPGNTLDAAAFQRFQTTTSSMSSLPTIHLNETFANLPTHGGDTVESMGGRGDRPEALLAVPMFHSSMPTLPRISGSNIEGMDGVHEASRHMSATAGPLGQGSNRYPFVDGHPRSPDNSREVYSPDIEPAPSILPPAALQQAGGSSDAGEEEDAGEWFPVGALNFATAQSHGSSEPAALLKLEDVRKGMLVRVGGVPQLRRAIESHRIDGQQAFEWKDEDAKWAGLVGMVLEVDSGGVIRVDTSRQNADVAAGASKTTGDTSGAGTGGHQTEIASDFKRTHKQAMQEQLTAASQQLQARLERQQQQRQQQEQLELQRQSRNKELQRMDLRQLHEDVTHISQPTQQPLSQPPQMAPPQSMFPPAASPNRRFMQTTPSLLTVAEEDGDEPLDTLDTESVSSYQPAEASPVVARRNGTIGGGILKAGRADNTTDDNRKVDYGRGIDSDDDDYDDDVDDEEDEDGDDYANRRGAERRKNGGFDNPFGGNGHRRGVLKNSSAAHESAASSMMFRTSTSLYEVDAEITEEEMWDLHVDVVSGERFYIHR